MNNKILILVRSLSVGGAERQAILNTIVLNEKKWNVTLAVFYHETLIYDQAMIPEKIQTIILSNSNKKSIFSVLKGLYKLVLKNNYCIIYSFTGVPNIIAALCKIIYNNIKIIWGIRATNINQKFYPLKYKIEVFIEKLLCRIPDLIISNSNAGARDIIKKGYPSQKIAIIPNAIDTHRFKHPNKSIQYSKINWFKNAPGISVIGCIGRLDPMKDHKTLLHAFKYINDIDNTFRLAIIGQDPKGLKTELILLAQTLGIVNKIVWIEHCSEIENFYKSFDIFTLSSAYGEGFSNVLAESMACGVPCVATDVGDANVIIDNYGIVVPPNDSVALANGWLSIYKNKYSSDKLWESIDSRFSIQKLGERMEKILLRF
jgi:glycosyltransferase involved in cell wall biosynthesis